MTIERAPGGLPVLSGGTRTSVKLDRPWQSDILVDPTTCRLEIAVTGGEIATPGWQYVDNPYTPLNFHKLIMPTTCWPKEEVKTLGGLVGISTALNIAISLNRNAQDRWLGVHVGPSAGQNQPHLHYHLVDLPGSLLPTHDLDELYQSEEIVIYENLGIKAVVAGVRAGQCFLLPISRSPPVEALATAINAILSTYSRAFRSTQGLAPDYMLAVRFRNADVVYAVYIPILNQWGFSEFIGLIEGTPLVLPWPHKETVRHIRDSEKPA